MLKFFRILIGAIFVVPLLIISYVFYLIVMLLRKCGAPKASDSLMWFTLRFLVHAIMFFFGARMHVVGKENIPSAEGKYCYIGNHQSMFDIVALVYPLLRAVYLDRKNPRQSLKAIIDGSRMIEAGTAMSIFPEGTRSKDGHIHEFKAGSFKMVSRVGGVIVPIVCKGTRTVFEDGNSLLPRPVYIQFLPHIDTAGMSDEELHELPEKVRGMVQEAYDRLPPVKGLVIREMSDEAEA